MTVYQSNLLRYEGLKPQLPPPWFLVRPHNIADEAISGQWWRLAANLSGGSLWHLDFKLFAAGTILTDGFCPPEDSVFPTIAQAIAYWEMTRTE